MLPLSSSRRYSLMFLVASDDLQRLPETLAYGARLAQPSQRYKHMLWAAVNRPAGR